MFSGDTGLRGRRPGFGPLSLRSDQTGHRGLGEERKERERAHACACPGTREEDRESPRPRPRPRAFLLGPSCTFSRRTSHAYKTVTCIEQAWAPSLVSDGAGRPSAGARLSRADATGGWIYRYIDAGPRWRPGGRPRHRGQLPTAPAPLPEQTCARCSGRTCSGQLAALSAVDAGVPTTRSLNAAPAGGWRSADGPGGGADGPHPARYRLSFSPRLAQTVHALAQCAWPRVDRRRTSTPPLTAGHFLNTAALFFPKKTAVDRVSCIRENSPGLQLEE